MIRRINIPETEIGDELGHGAHSVVYRGRHRGEPCAVKIPRSKGRWTRWVYREAVALARVRHPALPVVLEVGESEGLPYLIMELVEGDTLADRLRRGPLYQGKISKLIEVAESLADALAAVHDAGLVHRDVKPRNIVLESGGRVRLVDFGFAAPMDVTDAGGGAGTPGYAAPEQLRTPSRIDGRADLFALGRVISECLATRSDAHGPRASTPLFEICSSLLEEDPSRRYPDARSLCDDLALLRAGGTARGPGAYEAIRYTSPLVGRDGELRAIAQLWAGVGPKAGVAAVVRGARGSGKTCVLRAAAVDAASEGRGRVLSVRCRDGDPPLAVLRRAFEAFLAPPGSEQAPARAERETALRTAVEDHLGAFATLIAPSLTEVLGNETAILDADPEAFAEGAAEILLRLARRVERLMLCVDDYQWIDPVSRDVLGRLAHRLREGPVMLLLGTREERGSHPTSASAGQPLALGRHTELELRGFGEAQVAALACSYLNVRQVDPALGRRIAVLADGTPLGILEVLGAFLDVGAVRPHARDWLFDAERAETVALPEGALVLLGHRLLELPAATRRVLEVAAIVGVTFPDELLARVVGLTLSDVDYALADARRAGLVESDERRTHRFVHDSLREMLVAELGDTERRAAHQRVAEVLDATGDGTLDALCARALHYASGDLSKSPEPAYRAARAAAAAALVRFDNETALRFMELALLAARAGGLMVDATFHRSLAEAQLRLGALDHSLLSFEEALAATESKEGRAVLLGRIAWVHQASGNPERAWGSLARAFAAIGITMPTDSATSAAQTFGHLARAQLEKMVPRTTGEAVSNVRALDLLCELHYQNARLGLEYGKPLRLLQSTLEARRLSKPSGVSRPHARASALYGAVLSAVGRHASGARELSSARTMSQSLGDPVVRTFCLQMEAMAAAMAGKLDESLLLIRECLETHGHWLELNEYLLLAATADLIQGLRGHATEGWSVFERATERLRRSNRKPSVIGAFAILRARASLASLGRAIEDDLWLARQLEAIDGRGASPRGFYDLASWGPRARFLVDSGNVGAEFEELVRTFEREGHNPKSTHILVSEYYVAVVHGRIHQCLRAGAAARAPHVAGLRRAIADLKAAAKIPLLEAHYQLAEAHLAWFDGDAKKASKLFATAQALADQESCSWVLYGIARARAHMLRERGRHEAARDEASVADMLARAHGAEPRARFVREELDLPSASPAPPSNAPRSSQSSASRRARRQLTSLLHIVGAPHAGLRPAQQATTILDALLRDLDAENGLLWFQPDPGSSAGLLIGRTRGGRMWNDVDGRQGALIRSVQLASGAPAPGGGLQSKAEPNVDSGRFLSFPLFLYDDTVGAVCLERRRAQPTFSIEDRELLELLSHQVPIALEIARLLVERARLQTSLQQVQKMEAVGELAGGVAHDFNNMLMVVKASLDTLGSHPGLDGEVTEELGVIGQALDRATQLTRRLLSFSRHQPVSLVPVDVNAAIDELAPMLRRILAERTTVETRLGTEVPLVQADRAALEQALVNLVVNARDAMTEGGAVVISTGPAVIDEEAARQGGPKAGAYAVIEVTDSGQGMTQEVLARVFDPFFTTKPQGGGTGLGLTMVFAFAKNSGGHVTVESEPGRGTTFRVYLPRGATAEAPAVVEVPAALPPKVVPPQPFRDDMAILVVDDDRQVRESIRRVLHRGGYRVLIADGGEEALQIVSRVASQISLVILDVMMPGMTGPEVARRLAERELPAKVLFVSGFAPGNLPVEMGKVSSEMLLQKPFASAELLRRVEQLVGY